MFLPSFPVSFNTLFLMMTGLYILHFVNCLIIFCCGVNIVLVDFHEPF